MNIRALQRADLLQALRDGGTVVAFDFGAREVTAASPILQALQKERADDTAVLDLCHARWVSPLLTLRGPHRASDLGLLSHVLALWADDERPIERPRAAVTREKDQTVAEFLLDQHFGVSNPSLDESDERPGGREAVDEEGLQWRPFLRRLHERGVRLLEDPWLARLLMCPNSPSFPLDNPVVLVPLFPHRVPASRAMRIARAVLVCVAARRATPVDHIVFLNVAETALEDMRRRLTVTAECFEPLRSIEISHCNVDVEGRSDPESLPGLMAKLSSYKHARGEDIVRRQIRELRKHAPKGREAPSLVPGPALALGYGYSPVLEALGTEARADAPRDLHVMAAAEMAATRAPIELDDDSLFEPDRERPARP